MNRLRWKFPAYLLAAGIAGGIFVAGCSGRDVRQQAVATVNGDPIKVGELRESLGVPAGVFAVPEIPVDRKKVALDQLVMATLLAQEGHALGLDNTSEFKEILQRNAPRIRIRALLRKEIEANLKVTDGEIKAEIARVKESSPGISDADATMRAVKSVSGSRVKKIQEDLLATARKEMGAAAGPNPKETLRDRKGEEVPDDVVLSERALAMRALEAYAEKQRIAGSEVYKSMREEMERSVLRRMVVDNVAAKNVVITDREVEEEIAKNTAVFTRGGKKLPPGAAAQIKEMSRATLLRDKRKAVVEAYLDALRKKAKITVNDAILPKV